MLTVAPALPHNLSSRRGFSAMLAGVRTMGSGVSEILRGYGQIVLCGRRRSGALVLAATLGWPLGGLSGLIAATTAVLVGRRLPGTEVLSAPGLYACNGALAGIALAAHMPTSVALGLAPAVGLLAAVLLVAMSRLLAPLQLPPLSLPFVLATWCVHFIPSTPVHGAVPAPLTRLLEVLAILVFASSAGAGALLAGAVTLHSWRQAALMAASLPIVAAVASWMFGGLHAAALTAVNMELSLVAISVVFLPGRFGAGLVAALLTLGVSLGCGPVLAATGLPMAVLPFNVATLATLWWMRRDTRTDVSATCVPAELVEVTHHVTLSPPFFGQWMVSQGVNGQPTHQGEGRHAWDFVVVDGEGRTHRALGLCLDDYYAFGIPVRAPVDGTVRCVVDDVEDNLPPHDNREGHFGNFVIIESGPSVYVQVAHLRNGTVTVALGDEVARGQVIGCCGSSGRSLEPHIHVQAQTGDYPGAPSLPAVFVGVAVEDRAGAEEGAIVPQLGERLRALS